MIPIGLAFPIASDGSRASARTILEIPEDRFAIFVVGRMEYQKNHQLALRALAAMRPEIRANVLLCFAGSGEGESELRELSHELGVDSYVRFLGYRQNLRELLPAADITLMTSFFEGMPLALIEAMSAGIPIVTTPWTGSRTMLGDGRYGFITRNYEPENVARTIERAIEHPLARKTVAENAQRYVEESFSIGRMIDGHVDLYRMVAGAAR
ncbi:MAG: glycosyltransferase family 4 protein [Candidatus Eremiobacteraeota bacterium]|nr:glycosyltransferase family 4 protein [Candidatus Eremiobacteraeota bacterium]